MKIKVSIQTMSEDDSSWTEEAVMIGEKDYKYMDKIQDFLAKIGFEEEGE